MSKGKAYMPCGCWLETADVENTPVGERVITFTSPHQGNQSPHACAEYLKSVGLKGDEEGMKANCLIACPVSQRKGGAKHSMAYFKGGSKPGHIVTCKIVKAEKD